jgi:hypothetical protein
MPTTNSPVYVGPVTVSATETLQAIAVASGYPASALSAAAYTINTTAVATPGFSVAVNPGTLSVTAGDSGMVKVTVTAQNSFSAPLTFSCAGLPAGATCSFSPATVTPVGGTASTALMITTSPSAAALPPSRTPWIPGSVLAGVLCFFGRKKRRGLQMLMLALVGLGLSVCGGCGANQETATKVTTSAVTVIATSGPIQLSTTLTVALQQGD